MTNPNGKELKKSLQKNLTKSALIDLVIAISAPIACNPEMSPEQKINEIQGKLFDSVPYYVFVPQEPYKPNYKELTAEWLADGNIK